MGTLLVRVTCLFSFLVCSVDRSNSQNYRNYPYQSRQSGNGFSPSQPHTEADDQVPLFNTSSTFNPSDHTVAQDGQESHNSQDREDYSQSNYVPRPPPPSGNRPLTNSYYVPQNPGIAGSNYINHNGYPGSYLPGIGVPGSGGVVTGSNKYFPSIPISVSKYVSGDYCWEPLVNCDTANTVLYCVKGRCACPTDWTLAPGNLPLNTVWHPSYKRCVSLIGSGCHMSPTNSAQGYVYCQPGVECVPHSTYSEVGICGKASSSLSTSYSLIFSCLMCIFTALKLSGVVKTEYTSFY